jgi:hypothetical protein
MKCCKKLTGMSKWIRKLYLYLSRLSTNTLLGVQKVLRLALFNQKDIGEK